MMAKQKDESLNLDDRGLNQVILFNLLICKLE